MKAVLPSLLSLGLAVVGVPALAAGSPGRVVLTETQISSLGITLAAPESASRAAGERLGGRVVPAPEAEWVVTAPVAGVVRRVAVAEGEAVARAAVLAELDSAEAPQLAAQLVQAETAARLARAERDRDRALFGDGIIAQRRVQTSEAAAEQAGSALDAIRSHLEVLGIRPAEARAGRVALRAPSAATVIERLVRPGQRVAEGDALLRLVDAQRLQLEVQVPVDALPLTVGDTLALPDGGRATVRQAGYAASDSAQTLTARAVLPAGADLRPGQWLRVQREQGPAGEGAVLWRLPAAAVVREANQTWVFVRTTPGFAVLPVTVAGHAGPDVLVQGGLREGVLVATRGLVALKGAWLGHGGAGE